jgi:hypothetical protein
MVRRCNILARCITVALILVCGAGAPAIAQPGYLQDVTDMPLPAGFTEDSAAGVAFDKPGGRIIEAAARGAGSVPAVVTFYRNVLPELGWSESGQAENLVWQRDGEMLRIEVTGIGAEVAVRFHIAPQ